VPPFRSSGSFGKRQEFIVVAELLRRGYDVYMTLVDDQQIDCVVRVEGNSHPYTSTFRSKLAQPARSNRVLSQHSPFEPPAADSRLGVLRERNGLRIDAGRLNNYSSVVPIPDGLKTGGRLQCGFSSRGATPGPGRRRSVQRVFRLLASRRDS